MGYHPILDFVYTLLSHIPMEMSSFFYESEQVCKNVIAGATDPENLFGVSFLSFKGSMYSKKIPAIRKKSQNGIAYLYVNCHLDGKLYDARLVLKSFQSAYYNGSDTFVALSEIPHKRKHQSPRSNAKIGLLFDDESDESRLGHVKRQL